MSKPARCIVGITFDGKPIFEPIASASGRIAPNPLSAVQVAQREDGVDTPMILDKIANTLIKAPPGDKRNQYWRESPREFLHAASRIELDFNSQMASDDQRIEARMIDE